jgi:hypothetical protein
MKLMARFVRVGVGVLAGLGLLAMSSCMMVSGAGGFGSTSPTSGYSFGGGGNSGSGGFSAASHSFFGGSASSGSSSANSSAGSYASSATSGSGDPGSGGAVPPGYSLDSSQSRTLSSYLQSHRLPLVGAQVLTNDRGNRQVVLYGFVATDFGKQDAGDKARRYLNDPSLAVINRIAVRPQLLASGSGNGTAPPSPPTAPSSGGTYGNGNLGSVQSYENQARTQQYMQNQSGLAALLPLITMMGMLNFGSGGAGMGYGGGYPPTYGSPFGTPYSPYGVAPYGSPYPPGYGGYGGGGFTFP